MKPDILNETEIACLRLIMQVGLTRMAALVQTSNVLVSVSMPVNAKAEELELEAGKLDAVFPELNFTQPKRGPKFNTTSKRNQMSECIRDAIRSGITKRKDIKFFALSKFPTLNDCHFNDAARHMKDLVKKNQGNWSLTHK